MANIKELLSKLTFDAIRLPQSVHQSAISAASVQKAFAQAPRRICFSSTHRTALKENASGKFVGSFSVPFTDTIYPLFYSSTGLELYKSKYEGWWRSIKTADEFEAIQNWIGSVHDHVFLRDCLALSLALAEHQLPEGGRSAMGELEYQAKYHRNNQAILDLAQHCIDAVTSLPHYKNADAICAVPPREGKDFDLPTILAKRVADNTGKDDISSILTWKACKPSLKGIAIEEKWAKLEEVGLNVEEGLKGKKIIVLDDLYQSGVTMQFVAKALLDAGARHIYGLAIVKSRNDSDNV